DFQFICQRLDAVGNVSDFLLPVFGSPRSRMERSQGVNDEKLYPVAPGRLRAWRGSGGCLAMLSHNIATDFRRVFEALIRSREVHRESSVRSFALLGNQ